MYNPFSGWQVSGTWADHMSYSLGGIDYPLPYGTPLPAPAAGTLRTSGGSGEFAAGWVGTAGRRSILTLDAPVAGLVAIVFQHQSRFGVDGHYSESETAGWSGASASGNDWGGQVHLHTHGLTAAGNRVDWIGYIGLTATPSATVAASTVTKLAPAATPTTTLGEFDMFRFTGLADATKKGQVFITGISGRSTYVSSPYHFELLTRFRAETPGDSLLEAELAIVRDYLARIA